MRIFFRKIDWVLFIALMPILGAGLITMRSFTGDTSLFDKQLLWILISIIIFFTLSAIDVRILKNTKVLVLLFIFFLAILTTLFIVGRVVNGAQSWFDFGGFSFQPTDFMKVIVILLLAKYFSRRHVEIAHFKHIFISGIYALVPFLLVFLQPDFGSAIIIFLIWFGMILVSGISKKHLLLVLGGGLIVFLGLWLFVFQQYQRDRIVNFIHPLADIHGSGYNAYQSTIAVGSGKIFGKGVGYGTQSRLQFLPEYQTDFIFAAFAEEWGFVGVIILFTLYGIVIWRILKIALVGHSNFEILYGMGVAIFFFSHFVINVGMNIGLMPVTGITLPFMSYGGSHLLGSFAALGILMSMRGYSRSVHRNDVGREFLGYST
ncbi:rod shape-determining protein RodA [Candidatus Nomurabacteria bacterium]|nr:MAG: rod shape-determining protein RodA [Candidatus Nomurabacteria bacterium]